MDLQQAFIYRDKTIAKQKEIFNLPIPNVRYSKQELRTGMQGRVQRREERRFTEKVKKQKAMYTKQKMDLDKYIISLQAPQSVGEIGTSAVSSPVPTTSFFGTPRLGKIRNIKQRGRR